jgi:hypothetical protein
MNETELREKLAADEGTLPWCELERHFARGVLIVVAADLILVDAATRVALDDAATVRTWMEAGRLIRATEDHARRWGQKPERHLKAVVVAPWILVQE